MAAPIVVGPERDVAVNETLARRAFDRRMFMASAILFPLIILAGFARTYYLRGFFDVPPLPSMLVHAHGLLMTAWVALFVTQVWFISSRRVRLHQRLGYGAIWLAVAIVIVGFLTALRAAKFGSGSTPPDIPPVRFLVVPATDLLMFAIFFGGAVYYRKKPAEHKRLMLLTAINFLPPALARIPIASFRALGPLTFFGVPTVLVLFCVALDAWRHKHLNRIFLSGALLLIASFVGRLVVMGTDTWLAIATWLTSFV
jgi:hypothetical protein